MSIGKRLRAERVYAGLNQTEFGALGGVKKLAQVHYENDERSPDAIYLSQLDRKGIDILYVLTGRREKTQNMK